MRDYTVINDRKSITPIIREVLDEMGFLVTDANVESVWFVYSEEHGFDKIVFSNYTNVSSIVELCIIAAESMLEARTE